MATIAVTINGRPFSLACDDGEEARIRRLAQYVERKVAAFVERVGQIGEARLILLAALVIADELAEANARLEAAAAGTAPPGDNGAAAGRAAESLVGLAQRLEAIAARFDSA
ncbi:MAG TPA: cell division protein ZapA [Stellaceae bacterium]|nr:cell division protein ZapA [Stellaceae bacterium]